MQSTLASQHSFIYDDVQSRILTADLLGGDINLDPQEKRAIYREIHGRNASDDDDAARHNRYEQLEREIWKLPKEDKAALMRVLRKNPLLFVVSSQTKLFLLSEDFDAARAARRIARYWQRREDLFGEEHVLKDGDVPTPNLEDYNRSTRDAKTFWRLTLPTRRNAPSHTIIFMPLMTKRSRQWSRSLHKRSRSAKIF